LTKYIDIITKLKKKIGKTTDNSTELGSGYYIYYEYPETK